MKEIAAWRKKSTHEPREESITAEPEGESITEDLTKNLSLRTLKRILSLKNLKRTLSLWNIKTVLAIKSLGSGFRIFNDFCVTKKSLFTFLVKIYNRVGDGDKFSWEKFGLVRPCFIANSHLKIEAKIFFSETLMPQCNSWLPHNCH